MALTDRLRAIQALPSLPPGAPAPTAEEPQQQGIPRPRQLRPKRPRGMSAKARRIWREVVDELEHLGILDRLDKGALTRYCTYRVEWDDLTARLERPEDFFQEFESGASQVSAIFTARKQLEASIHSLESELGLTPASRSRLMFAAYGGRPLAAPKTENKRGLRGAYHKRGKPK